MGTVTLPAAKLGRSVGAPFDVRQVQVRQKSKHAKIAKPKKMGPNNERRITWVRTNAMYCHVFAFFVWLVFRRNLYACTICPLFVRGSGGLTGTCFERRRRQHSLEPSGPASGSLPVESRNVSTGWFIHCPNHRLELRRERTKTANMHMKPCIWGIGRLDFHSTRGDEKASMLYKASDISSVMFYFHD